MGNRKIIQIGEHKVALPPYPKDRRDIYMIDEKPENAVWRRIQYSELFYKYIPEDKVKSGDVFTRLNQKHTVFDDQDLLISLSETDTIKVLGEAKRDMQRRLFGMWMRNGEDIIWVAPDYYYTLQWGTMKDLEREDVDDVSERKMGMFRWIQNDVMILWWYIRYCNWIAGIIYPKCKKSGITQIFSTAFLNEATAITGLEMGAVSKDGDHVQDVFMADMFYAYDTLPLIIKPSEAKRNLTEIILGKEIKKTGSKLANNHIADGNNVYLGSRINGYKTKTNAFDGPVMKRVFVDEPPKMYESSHISVDLSFTKTIAGLKLGSRKINGKGAWVSYMPETDDMGYIDFVRWCKKSFLSTVNKKSGRTESELIIFPITADVANEECYDKFGKCDKRKAFTLVTEDYNAQPTLADKQGHKRQHPLSQNDMFDSGGRGTTFDNLRLGIQSRIIDEHVRTGIPPYKYLQLDWENEDWNSGKKGARPKGQFCEVKIIELDPEAVMMKRVSAPFFQYEDFLPEALNQVIRKKSLHEDDDKYCPIKFERPGVFGLDPVDYVMKKLIVDGSTNAGVGGYLYDAAMDALMKKPYTNLPIIDYYMREENPDDDYENWVKLIILTGWYKIVESNKPWVLNKLFDDDLHHFCIVKHPEGYFAPYKPGVKVTKVTATQDTIDDYVRKLKRWMAPVRYEGDFDYITTIKRPLALTQFMGFDPTDTKPFDIPVCYGWWRTGMDVLADWLVKEKESEVNVNLAAFDEAMDILGSTCRVLNEDEQKVLSL